MNNSIDPKTVVRMTWEEYNEYVILKQERDRIIEQGDVMITIPMYEYRNLKQCEKLVNHHPSTYYTLIPFLHTLDGDYEHPRFMSIPEIYQYINKNMDIINRDHNTYQYEYQHFLEWTKLLSIEDFKKWKTSPEYTSPTIYKSVKKALQNIPHKYDIKRFIKSVLNY